MILMRQDIILDIFKHYTELPRTFRTWGMGGGGGGGREGMLTGPRFQ